MNSAQRIKELKTRQIYYGSSLVCKLRKVNKVFHYDILLWVEQDDIINKGLVISGIYNDEDPEELFKKFEATIGVRYKLGKPQVRNVRK